MDYRQKRDMIRLRDHLATDPHVRRHWDFGRVTNATWDSDGPYACGSQGCAMAWLPILFEEFSMDQHGHFSLEDGDGKVQRENIHVLSSEFFGLTVTEGEEIFVMGFLNEPQNITPLVVADRIDQMVNKYFPPKQAAVKRCVNKIELKS